MGKTTFYIFIALIISKIFGFAREILLSFYFGASSVTDSFLMATSITATFFTMFFSALATMYIPSFTKITTDKDLKAGQEFTNNLYSISLFVSLIVSLLVFAFSDIVIELFAPGFDSEVKYMTINFLRITVLSLLFTPYILISLNYLKISKHYIKANVIPILNNLLVIVFILISTQTNYYILGIGYVLGYITQASVLKYILRSNNFTQVKTFKVNEDIKSLFKMAVPVMFSSSLNLINSLVDKMIASGLPIGSLSSISYATIITGTLFGILTEFSGTFFFPLVSKLIYNKEYDKSAIVLKEIITFFMLVIIPATFGLMFFSNEIVQFVFGRGEFGESAIILTSTALFFASIGILFSSIINICSNVLYALYKTKMTLLVSFVVVLVNIIFSLTLTPIYGISGLVFSTSLSVFIGSVLSMYIINIFIPHIKYVLILLNAFKIVVSATIMIICSKLFNSWANMYILEDVSLFVSIIIATIIYTILISSMKIKEIEDLKIKFSKKSK